MFKGVSKRNTGLKRKENTTSVKASMSMLESRNEAHCRVNSVLIKADKNSNDQMTVKNNSKGSAYNQILSRLTKKSKKSSVRNGTLNKVKAQAKTSNETQQKAKFKNANDKYKKSCIPFQVDLSESNDDLKGKRNRSLTSSFKKRKGMRIPSKKSLISSPVKKPTNAIARPKTSRSRIKNIGMHSFKTEQTIKPSTRYDNAIEEDDFTEKTPPSTCIERYENMLKEVNNEFQTTLKKNSELYEQVGNLEINLRKAENELSKIQYSLDLSNKAKIESEKEIEKERSSFEKATQRLSHLVQEKNDEIRRLKSVQLDLENKLLQTQNSSMKSTETHNDLHSRITKLVQKVTDLDMQLGQKDEDMHRLNMTNESLHKEIKQCKQKESTLEYKIGVSNSENSALKADNDILRSEKLKAGIIIKENLTEVESLKRELTLTQNNLKFCQKNEDQCKDENFSLRSKLQKLEREELRYRDQVESLKFEHDSFISKLVALEEAIVKGLSDQTLIRSKLSSIINTFRVSGHSSKLLSHAKPERFVYERPRQELARFRSLTEEKIPVRAKLRDLNTKNESAKQKVDPMVMKPAGKKSNHEVDLRTDSIEYLDRNRAKTYGEKSSFSEIQKFESSQSGKIRDSFLSSRSILGESLGIITEKNLSEIGSQYSPVVESSKPSVGITEMRSNWEQRRIGNVFELDSQRETKCLTNKELYESKNIFPGESRHPSLGENEVDSILRTYEERHKPYEWQISKAQIDLSREYQSNF
ncbi:unnamed protein product [Moneuplotes crassus]|uniref:Uncharacterized protein n=1 Tax=Euplotes crassus TaxID=5936 RepID=A0AAD1Y6F2_EUPCR|nr:unnamed protein product [Moneuplotes crassus]